MLKLSLKKHRLLLGLFILSTGLLCADFTPPIVASKDNSIYEEGALSNGAGSYLFAGRTGASGDINYRRALMQFDISSAIPVGSTIDSVTLQLYVNRVPIGDEAASRIFSLHRMESDWGEGTSDAEAAEGQGAVASAGDATWNYAFYPDQLWPVNAEGGDLKFSASASTALSDVGSYTWTSEQMRIDVQYWYENPNLNFGWILIGPTVARTARRFASRENGTAENRPALTIEFTPPTHWAGYQIMEDYRTVYTGDYLGYVDIAKRPWIYVYNLQQWIYLPEENVTAQGGWGYLPR